MCNYFRRRIKRMVVLLKPENYYTQRNNKLIINGENVSWRACMPTARVMFYIANNIPYENPTQMADDDYFMHLLNTQEAKDFCYSKYPWAYNKNNPEKSIPPNEVHSMYNQYLDVKVCGKKVSSFENQKLDWDYYIDSIVNKKKAIMTSGTFGNILGHAVVFIGYDEKSKELIIADPFGDFKSNYKNPRGYGVRMTNEDFNNHIKPIDSFLKNGHIAL